MDLNSNLYTENELKELQIIAAYLGLKDIVHYFNSEYSFIIDSDVLNAALLSGKFVGNDLHELTTSCLPNYDSIRYAIRSGNAQLLKDLIDVYHVKPTADHYLVAASNSNLQMFHILRDLGLKAEGNFVIDLIKQSKNPLIANWLIDGGNYPQTGFY